MTDETAATPGGSSGASGEPSASTSDGGSGRNTTQGHSPTTGDSGQTSTGPAAPTDGTSDSTGGSSSPPDGATEPAASGTGGGTTLGPDDVTRDTTGGDDPNAVYTHPGLLNTWPELHVAKARAKSGAEPWASGLAVLEDHAYRAHELAFGVVLVDPVLGNPQALEAIEPFTERTPHAHPVFTSEPHWYGPGVPRDAFVDTAAIYGNTLLWVMTDDEAHAARAVGLLNAWASTMEPFSDMSLFTSYLWPQTMWAAELLRSRYSGFTADQQRTYDDFLRDVVFPVASRDDLTNNWRSWRVAFLVTYGVYMDDAMAFDRGLGLFRSHLDSYVRDGAGYVYVSELCRDLNHAQMGLAPMVAAAEIAWKQGVDLYGHANDRLLGALEHLAAVLLGDRGQIPPNCKVVEDETSILFSGWEMAKSHYEARRGLPTPQLTKLLDAKTPLAGSFAPRTMRPEGYNRLGYGTLTHVERP